MGGLISCTAVGVVILVGAWIGVLHWCGFFDHDDEEQQP